MEVMILAMVIGKVWEGVRNLKKKKKKICTAWVRERPQETRVQSLAKEKTMTIRKGCRVKASSHRGKRRRGGMVGYAVHRVGC